LVVNSTADTANPSDPYLSLREAITIVNSSSLPSGLSAQILAQIHGTLHAGDADTVSFDSAIASTPITFTHANWC
jgi:CSLREA domain-containing protein